MDGVHKTNKSQTCGKETGEKIVMGPIETHGMGKKGEKKMEERDETHHSTECWAQSICLLSPLTSKCKSSTSCSTVSNFSEFVTVKTLQKLVTLRTLKRD